MDVVDFVTKRLGRVNPRLLSAMEKRLTSIPWVKTKKEKEYDGIREDLESALKPYREGFATYDRLPPVGRDREDVLRELEALGCIGAPRWGGGGVSGAGGGWGGKGGGGGGRTGGGGEAEAVNAVKGQSKETDLGVCGTVTSGGTESILLAMKTYRDRAREQKGITQPERIAPVTAHAAFDKAAQYFGIKMVRLPVDADYRADVTAARKAITRNTIVIVGSAPSFPHGIVDPIQELSELAQTRDIGFHTDACLGGFVLPWAEKLGYPVPRFDFRLPGVTSMSADTHKYGYAAKGTSVVLYRSAALRRYQYFTATDWPGGLYFSPTFAGSQPGALSAACWAAMVSIGEQGYMEATRRILETAAAIRRGIEEIPDLYVLGDPLWVIAFGSKTLDIYKVMDFMARRKWNLNGLHKPPCVHICVTLRHTQPGVAERFVDDLRAAVEHLRANPHEEGGMAPVYGMAATLPLRGVVGELLKRYMDLLYRV